MIALPQPSVTARSRAIRLTKTIEHVRQELRLDANASIDHFEISLITVHSRDHLHFAIRLSELDRVGNDIPGDLLQTDRLAHHDQNGRR